MKKLNVSDLLLNEFAIIKEVVEGNSELAALYSSYIPKLVNRLERYFIMTNQKDDMLGQICRVLDSYDLVYSQSIVVETLEKSKNYDFIPLRQIDCEVKIYKGEIAAINQLQKRADKQLAFSLLVASKLKNARYGKPAILLSQVIDIQRMNKSTSKTKERVYFELHHLVAANLITVPLIGDELTIDFAQYDGEVAYVLNNTDILKLNVLFNNLFGEYQQTCQPVLMIDLNSNAFEIFDSVSECERNMKVQSSTIGRCNKLKDRFCANKQFSFILLGQDQMDNEEYVSRVCHFMREYVKPNFKNIKKNHKNAEWIISEKFMGCIDKESGEVLLQMQ